MQTKTLRLIFLLLAVFSLLLCASCKRQNPDNNSPSESLSLEEKAAAQKRAVDANEALMGHFGSNGSAVDYPDYFGGAYIEENKLHVRLVNPSQQTLDTLKSVFSGYQDVVIYEDAAYSRAALLEYMDKLMTALLKEDCGVTEGSVSSKTGDISIAVIEEDLDRAKQLVEQLQKDLWKKNPPRVEIMKGYPIQLD